MTDADGFPRWNSTVTRVEGEIREVSDVVSDTHMTGVRTFELKPCDDGPIQFAMEERFSGLMLPFVRGSMPDFDRFPL